MILPQGAKSFRRGKLVLNEVLPVQTTNTVLQSQNDANPKAFLDQPEWRIRVTHDTINNHSEKPWYSTSKHDVYTPQAQQIMVVVPAWRDVDAFNTVYDLYITASNPSRVHVLVVMQTQGVVADRYWHSLSQINLNAALANHGYDVSNITWVTAPSEKIRGAGTARRIAWSYLSCYPCDYVLSIDSHSRFALGWDSYLIAVSQELKSHGFAEPCLSFLPLGFDPSPELDAWAKSQSITTELSKTPPWDAGLGFVQSRLNVVSKSWDLALGRQPLPYSGLPNAQGLRQDPFLLWKNITNTANYPDASSIANQDQIPHPTIAKGSVELMMLGFLMSGFVHYQGQFLPDYNQRIKSFEENPDHPAAGVLDVASPATKLAGGMVFLSSALAQKIEFSSFFKADDELLPSMRLIRAGASMFTPNWNPVFHWYGRAGLPRPGWTHEVYNLSSTAMLNELGFLYYDVKKPAWYELDTQAGNYKDLKAAGFVLNSDDLVQVNNDCVRSSQCLTKEAYYNKVGFHRLMLLELDLMECSSKREIPDLELTIQLPIPTVYNQALRALFPDDPDPTQPGKHGYKDVVAAMEAMVKRNDNPALVFDKTNTAYYVRPFYVFQESLPTLIDVKPLDPNVSKTVVLELLDKYKNVVASKTLTMSELAAHQNNLEIKGTREVKVLTTMFCDPRAYLPVDFKAYYTTQQDPGVKNLLLSSELFSQDFRKHVLACS